MKSARRKQREQRAKDRARKERRARTAARRAERQGLLATALRALREAPDERARDAQFRLVVSKLRNF